MLSLDITDSPSPRYIALSHRWGSAADNVFRLTGDNESELMDVIPLDSLSRVFREAIDFTRDIGFRYLWIDSLCIMQNSAADWKRESALMDRVYARSTLNIAADLASSTFGGLFCERSEQFIRASQGFPKTVVRKSFCRKYNLVFDKNLHHSYARSFLHNRAWVVQERILSPRTLHFSEQLFWECRTHSANETFPRGIGLTVFGKSMKIWNRSREELFDLWRNILNVYLKSALTYPSDRLVALGAIATKFQSILKDDYCAGIWRGWMIETLSWYHSPPNDASPPTRPTEYRCPTWSWASLDFANGMKIQSHLWSRCPHPGTTKHLARVLDVTIESPMGNVYTEITSASIQLECYTIPWDPYWFDQNALHNGTLAEIGYGFDVPSNGEEADNLCMLPLFIWENLSGRQVCRYLLLSKCNTETETYTRVGIANSALRDDSPVEPPWSFHPASRETPTHPPKIITII